MSNEELRKLQEMAAQARQAKVTREKAEIAERHHRAPHPSLLRIQEAVENAFCGEMKHRLGAGEPTTYCRAVNHRTEYYDCSPDLWWGGTVTYAFSEDFVFNCSTFSISKCPKYDELWADLRRRQKGGWLSGVFGPQKSVPRYGDILEELNWVKARLRPEDTTWGLKVKVFGPAGGGEAEIWSEAETLDHVRGLIDRATRAVEQSFESESNQRRKP